jgi:hypothetical protein
VKHAARVLVRGDLLSATAIAAVARLLADPHQPEDVQRRLVQALGKARHDAAAQALFEMLKPHGLVELGAAAALRDLAAVALHGSPAPIAPKLFAEGLASTVWRVRRSCERAQKGEKGGGA